MLLNVATGEADDTSALDAPAKNAIYRASVVLLVSHFESYLKSSAEAFMDSIGDGTLETRRIPRGIRELHTLPSMTAILECNDDTQRQALLKKFHPSMVLWVDDAKPSPGTLKPKTLSREVTSAASFKIDRLFALMGLSNPVCDGDLDLVVDGETVSFDIRMALEDVVLCRNEIAHGYEQRRLPTEEDVLRYMLFLNGFAERLSRKTDALLEQIRPS